MPLQVLSLTCGLHSCCEGHATFSSRCLTTETYLTLFWPDFLFVYVASWGSDLEQLAYHQRALTQILRSVWQRGRGEKTLEGIIISDRWTRAFYTSAPFRLTTAASATFKRWIVVLTPPNTSVTPLGLSGVWMSHGGRRALRYTWTQNPSDSRIGFPVSPTNWCKVSPFQGSELALCCPGPLKRAAQGEGARNQVQEKVKEEVELNNLSF